MALHRFAFIVDGEVFTISNISTDDPNIPQTERVVAGLQSNPIVVEFTDYEGEVGLGYTWDGTNFTPPQE